MMFMKWCKVPIQVEERVSSKYRLTTSTTITTLVQQAISTRHITTTPASKINKKLLSQAFVVYRQHRWYTNSATTKNHTTTSSHPITISDQEEKWLVQQAMTIVKQYDPGAFIPGYILFSNHTNVGTKQLNNNATNTIIPLRTAYYTIRAFWIETGLRFNSTAQVPPNSTPLQHIQWWKDAIHCTLYDNDNNHAPTLTTTLTDNVHKSEEAVPRTSNETEQSSYLHHPIIRLLLLLKTKYNMTWSKEYFDAILQSRCKDLDVKQYTTIQDLIQYSEQSCGSITKLLLQSANIYSDVDTTNEDVYEAARLVGIGHGISNALRQSVATLSTAGKLIIPNDITTKYHITSPRYLLSALSGGDIQCEQALQRGVEEVAIVAQNHIDQARTLRPAILQQQCHPNTYKVIIQCLLVSTIPSEIFIQRLQHYQYKLTDRNLRYTNLFDQMMCATKTISSYYQSKY